MQVVQDLVDTYKTYFNNSDAKQVEIWYFDGHEDCPVCIIDGEDGNLQFASVDDFPDSGSGHGSTTYMDVIEYGVGHLYKNGKITIRECFTSSDTPVRYIDVDTGKMRLRLKNVLSPI